MPKDVTFTQFMIDPVHEGADGQVGAYRVRGSGRGISVEMFIAKGFDERIELDKAIATLNLLLNIRLQIQQDLLGDFDDG